jgi:hypothetical protein
MRLKHLVLAALMAASLCGVNVPGAAEIFEKQEEDEIVLRAALAHFKGRQAPESLPIAMPDPQWDPWFGVDGLKAMFWLDENDWICYIAKSSHSRANQVLAVDRYWNVYTNGAHVCPVLILRMEDGSSIDSLEDFAASVVYEEKGPLRWRRCSRPGEGLLKEVQALFPVEWMAALPATRSQHYRLLSCDTTVGTALRKQALTSLAKSADAEFLAAAGELTARRSDWALAAYALHLWEQPNGAERREAAFRDELTRSLYASEASPVQTIEQAILSAEDRETVSTLASLAAPGDRESLSDDFEAHARDCEGAGLLRFRSFPQLRNGLAACNALNPDRAARFYRSLLKDPRVIQREIGVYGLGELRAADAVEELRAVSVPEDEDSRHAGAVCVALAKIGSPAAHTALVDLLLSEPVSANRTQAVITVMGEICGWPGVPRGTWDNGCWVTPAEDKVAIAQRFAGAMNDLGDRHENDDKFAAELSNQARFLLHVVKEAASRP